MSNSNLFLKMKRKLLYLNIYKINNFFLFTLKIRYRIEQKSRLKFETNEKNQVKSEVVFSL